MSESFERRIKTIELELIALKTSSLYTSTKNSFQTQLRNVTTGTYRISYGSGGNPIISEVYGDSSAEVYGGIYPRTPSGTSQIVEVNTTGWNGSSYVTRTGKLRIISNYPVISITRI